MLDRQHTIIHKNETYDMNKEQIAKNKDCIRREGAYAGWYWFHKMNWLRNEWRRTMSAKAVSTTINLDTEPAYVHVPEVHISASGGVSPGAQRCGTTNSTVSKASTLSTSLRSGSPPEFRVDAPLPDAVMMAFNKGSKIGAVSRYESLLQKVDGSHKPPPFVRWQCKSRPPQQDENNISQNWSSPQSAVNPTSRVPSTRQALPKSIVRGARNMPKSRF